MSPHFHSEHARSCSHLLDGLSIPFFSAGRHTLTLSRSVVGDQPEWLNWVRRVPPQEDTERIAASPSGTVERQDHVTWPRLSDISDSILEGVRTPRKVLKFEDVCIALFTLVPSHLPDSFLPEGCQKKHCTELHCQYWRRGGACWAHRSRRGRVCTT